MKERRVCFRCSKETSSPSKPPALYIGTFIQEPGLLVSLLSQRGNGSTSKQEIAHHTCWCYTSLMGNSGAFQTAMLAKDLRFYARAWRSTRIFVLPALLRYHICLGHVYLYLPSCYFKVSSSAMTHIAPIHENINNWSPPVEYFALYVDMLVLEGVFFLWYVWFCICPSGQMLRLRPFGSEANVSVSKLCKQKLSWQNSAWQPCCVYWF